MGFAPAAPFASQVAVAASATTVDVSPQYGTGATGGVVVLTARVYDENGDLYAGTGTSTHVRFFFHPSSPNDIDSPGNSSDLDCATGDDGMCTVSYTAAVAGTDIICALLGGPSSQCDGENVGDPERNDRVDAVQHVNPGTPSPTPTPTPTPTATPTPTPVGRSANIKEPEYSLREGTWKSAPYSDLHISLLVSAVLANG